LEYHKKTCDFKTASKIKGKEEATEIMLAMQHKLEAYEKEHEEMKALIVKEREEMKAHIAILLDKYATSIQAPVPVVAPMQTTNNDNSNSKIDNQTNNNNNITININAFGNENTDYLDDKVIMKCIGRVYINSFFIGENPL
jgi:uncharacterized protein (UPF0333 family)